MLYDANPTLVSERERRRCVENDIAESSGHHRNSKINLCLLMVNLGKGARFSNRALLINASPVFLFFLFMKMLPDQLRLLLPNFLH